MTSPLLPGLALCALLGAVAAPSPVFSSELGTKELEDVSDAEKVKWARATKIRVGDAIRTATAHTPGQVIEAALHAINGRLLYEIEVVTTDDRVVELFVDPQTGKLIQQGETKR